MSNGISFQDDLLPTHHSPLRNLSSGALAAGLTPVLGKLDGVEVREELKICRFSMQWSKSNWQARKTKKSEEMIKKEEKELFQVKFGEAILRKRAKCLQG